MKKVELTVGYIPLLDSAPLLMAQEMGFAAQEGLDLSFEKAPSWSSLRDMLAFGRVDAAHMLAPVPVALSLGLGGALPPLHAAMTTSVNGNVIGVSISLAEKMRSNGATLDFRDATSIGHAMMTSKGARLRIGVPFPFSMHAELLYYWLSALGYAAPQGLEIRTVPPPLMANAVASGEIDAFCVGEPWGSIAVERGYGELILPTSAIWNFAPEKILAMRKDWIADRSELAQRLIRAVWRAGRWLSDPDSHTTATEILSRKDVLNVSREVIDRTLSGQLIVNQRGEERHVPNFIEFHKGAATFPWKSQAAWIARRMATRLGFEPSGAMSTARDVFRTDLYRKALAETTAALPGASEKVEGAIDQPEPAASAKGSLILERDRFFDGAVFDPYAEGCS
ncbi:ABC transporter substrate-binding protein [Donghicola eburneus]|uniref:Nitrate transporter n=1 Tax=Donghicola eburneus TaxID=393278 RepID=A0A1M4N4M3_9RHOB|nr:CmpA/NrtA family ABC transporter substrate-binding protein [Donghicola eburneus]SCM69840.1 hypothetical protein KARMA_4083 [Donghicola eburneus]SFQ65150.1 NitT/TauT family transport system ATP-binding protein [Donghicola eburneus]